MKLIKNFINHEFVEGEGQKTFTKLSPYSGAELAQVSEAMPLDLIKAIQSAKKAEAIFENSTLAQRGQILQGLADYFTSKKNEIAFEEGLYQGLPQEFVLKNGVEPVISLLQKTCEELQAPSTSALQLRPAGLVGIIMPWALSLKMVMERLVPALAAGNAVVVKMSELSPITTVILGEALQAAQAPAGLVNILNGPAEVGQMLAGHPGVRAISAAGRTSTVEAIAQAGLKQLKKLQLSGPAKNSALVLADVDFKKHMPEILRPFLVGQAQTCWNISRLFILDSVHKEFYQAAQEYLATLTPAKDPSDHSPWTPLIGSQIAESLDRHIASAQSEHGKILAGGTGTLDNAGFFHKPTVMVDLTNCSVIQQDEVAGPLLLLTPVKYQHEMVKWTNTSYLGQAVVIWGAEEKALKVIPKLEVAQVWVNSWMQGSEDMFFGHKQASFGNPDTRWNGTFYSDVKTLTGLTQVSKH